jgi:hypothetical protein
METLNNRAAREVAPVLESIETGLGTSIDFDTLARVMVRLRADYLQGDIADQVAAFEREVVAMELNPSPRDFERVKYAMERLGLFARVIEGREWTPGREDLTPLFEMDELTAS